MAEPDKCTVVVTLYEGRNFPDRPGWAVVLHGKFDSEELSSDPSEHESVVDIQNELAWVVTRKALQYHRTRRTPIKLQVCAVNQDSGDETKIGYIMLNLRMAPGNAKQVQWMPLLSPKYSKDRPEIKLALSVEIPKQTAMAASPARSLRSSPRRPPPRDQSPHPPTRSRPPVELGPDGILVVGEGSDIFSVTISLIGATGLPMLPEPNDGTDTSSYYLFYTFLGNDIMSPQFAELTDPLPLSERTIFKIKGSWPELRACLMDVGTLKIHLLTSDECLLGTATVPLQGLCMTAADPAQTVDGSFAFNPNDPAHVPPPAIKVSISVRTNQQLNDMISRLLENQSNPNTASSDVTSDSEAGRGAAADPVQSILDRGSGLAAGSGLDQAPMPPFYSDAGSTTSAEPARPYGLLATGGDDSDSFGSPSMQGYATAPPGAPAVGLMPMRPPQAGGNAADPPAVRRFCCTIDVRSIRALTMGPALATVYVRYAYPFLGSASPVYTQALEIARSSEKQFKNSFCSFQFVSSLAHIHAHFERHPIRFELFLSDKYSRNELIGSCDVDLLELFRSPPVLNQESRPIFAMDKYFLVRSADSATYKKVAELRVTSTFADLGEAVVEPEPESELDPDPMRGGAVAGVSISPSGEPRYTAGMAAADMMNAGGGPRPTAMPSETVQQELEDWKEAEMQLFKARLQRKEAELLKLLATEWKGRDTEREQQMTFRMQEYDRLEIQLKTAIKGIEARELSLMKNEAAVAKLQADLQRKYDLKIEEARDASRRLQTDVEHSVDLQGRKVRDLEELLLQAKEDRQTVDAQYRKLENEFLEYRQQVASTPVARLQEAVATSRMELLQTERKLDLAEQAKAKYKSQWSRALAEIAALRKRQQLVAKDSIRREQKELRHMRMQYLAREEQELADAEKVELTLIKDELGKLRQATADSQRSGRSGGGGGEAGQAAGGGAGVPDNVRRLVDERNSLLRSGIYSPTDRVIAELDQRIASLAS